MADTPPPRIWRIVRIPRKGRRTSGPETMHNHIEADTRAEALQRFHEQYPGVDMNGLEARIA